MNNPATIFRSQANVIGAFPNTILDETNTVCVLPNSIGALPSTILGGANGVRARANAIGELWNGIHERANPISRRTNAVGGHKNGAQTLMNGVGARESTPTASQKPQTAVNRSFLVGTSSSIKRLRNHTSTDER